MDARACYCAIKDAAAAAARVDEQMRRLTLSARNRRSSISSSMTSRDVNHTSPEGRAAH